MSPSKAPDITKRSSASSSARPSVVQPVLGAYWDPGKDIE